MEHNKRNLEGKIALVTGCGAGIGRMVALAFVQRGATVVIADIDEKGGQKTKRMLSVAGGESIFIKTDVSNSTQVRAMVRKTVKTLGRLDCAVNNAGIFRGINAPTHKCTERIFDEVISVNLKGVWLCMKYQVTQMLKQGSGVIVNVSSVAGLVGLKDNPVYSASKHGVIGLTKSAALEYASSGIRVNAVCPGSVNRPTVRGDKFFTVKKPDDGRHPMGRFCTSEEVAQAVVWLCSDDSSFVTGHALAVDGGWTAR